MKTLLPSLVGALMAAGAVASIGQIAVVISFPDDTPVSVISEAKSAIVTAGGMITHEYQLIKAFSAMAPTEALNTVQTLNVKFRAVIEHDQIVSANGS